MANIGENGSNGDREQNQAADSTFTNFARPYFDFIGTGQIYILFYIIMAMFNLFIPLGVIFYTIKSGFLQNSGTKIVVGFIFLLLVICFASWIGFQLWWYRKSSIKKAESSEFVATPIVSDLIQTFGEWVGTMIGIIGAGIGLVAIIFLGDSTGSLYRGCGSRLMQFSPLIIFMGPLFGFLNIIFFRFIAEQIRIFAAIANNTKEMVKKIRKAN